MLTQSTQALAYVMHKTPNVFPIVGQRKVEHLKANIDALSIQLSKEDLAEIDTAIPFDVGFPMSFIFRGSDYTPSLGPQDVFLTKMSALIDAPPKQEPVRPRKEV